VRFLIQSPKYGCSHIRNSLDKHLGTMRDNAKGISDEEFKTIQDARCTVIEEQDKNLNEVASRDFGEVAFHRYQWDRQAQEAAALRAITKQEWQQAFEELLFSDKTRRVDFRYNSEAHAEQEANTEFKFESDKRYSSVALFKKAVELHHDSFVTRYAGTNF